MDPTWALLVGGELTQAEGSRLEVVTSPINGEPIAEIPRASVRDVARAVESASGSQPGWHKVPARERAGLLRQLALALRQRSDEFSALDALDSGNPVTAMEQDVAHAAELLELVADWADHLDGVATRSDADHLHYTLREPCGVVARIVPYNHPLMFAASKLAAPLLAGNAVVLKAADQTPLSALKLGELIAEVFPPGVVNILSGPGADVGAALVRHPQVRRIAFTGSVATGQQILADAAATGIKAVTLELGGKNPMVVFEDADLDEAAAGAVRGMNFSSTAGQSCGSTSRLLVPRALLGDFRERLTAAFAELKVGDPRSPDTQVGTMVDQRHQQRVSRYIDRARERGLAYSAAPMDADPRGAYVAPTVFFDVDPADPLANEEIFGPVLSVLTYDDEDEAVRLMNGTSFGLTASIWTKDLDRAHRMSARIHAGYVWVNTVSRHFAGMPFGGVKDSGLGREESVEELHSFTQTKSVTVRVAQ